MKPAPKKICATCGRPFAWRAKWAADWPTVRYCSAGCRAHRPGPIDAAIEALIRRLLDRRAVDGICPSEVARALRPDGWRPLMERTRRAARRMAQAGEVQITQKGRAVDPGTFRGPIRIRRA